MMRILSIVALAVGSSEAWMPTSSVAYKSHAASALAAESSSRKEFLQTAAVTAMGSIFMAAAPMAAMAEEVVTLPSGVTYTIVKKGDGPQPDVGDLAAIRFSALCNGNLLDDIFDTPEPYYTRIGRGGLIKGVEQVLPSMRVGDRFIITVPGDLAFGAKGRPASAGKPRIPGGSIVVFEVEMVGLPGKEPELIELIGDV